MISKYKKKLNNTLIFNNYYIYSSFLYIFIISKQMNLFFYNNWYTSYLNKFNLSKNVINSVNITNYNNVFKNFFKTVKINVFIKKQKFFCIYVKSLNNCLNFLYNKNNFKNYNNYYFIYPKSFTKFYKINFTDANLSVIEFYYPLYNNLYFFSKKQKKIDYFKLLINPVSLYTNNNIFIYSYILNISFFYILNKNSFINKNYFLKKNSNNISLLLNLNNFKNIFNFLIFLNDFTNFKKNLTFFSNNYLIKNINIFDFYINSRISSLFNKKKFHYFNNYYPILFSNNRSYNSFFNKFKQTYNMNYISLLNKLIISFFETVFKKNIYLKVSNNYYYSIKNSYFFDFLNNYKNFQPHYFKNFLISDFLEILWYSFLLKDLNMLSNWITNFMETLNFKNHKKFIIFFQNFIWKNSQLFIDVLKIKGFYFDIRGKVGVTGSSKKRHICFKIGSLKKSSKKNKINFNQNLVRTYSGVLGLTYILCY